MAEAGAIGAPMKWALLALLIFGCKGEGADVLKRTIAETRSKPRVNVQIRLDRPDLPTAEELEQRRKLEGDIEQQNIGAILDSQAGTGYMGFTIEVDDTTSSIPRIRTLLQNAGVLPRSTIRIVSP
jgi:hypothetical protein